jgi:hypothetical protein
MSGSMPGSLSRDSIDGGGVTHVLGNSLLPMSQDWTIENLERAKGFEPSTPTLARLCSTPELRPRSDRMGYDAGRALRTESQGDSSS